MARLGARGRARFCGKRAACAWRPAAPLQGGSRRAAGGQARHGGGHPWVGARTARRKAEPAACGKEDRKVPLGQQAHSCGCNHAHNGLQRRVGHHVPVGGVVEVVVKVGCGGCWWPSRRSAATSLPRSLCKSRTRSRLETWWAGSHQCSLPARKHTRSACTLPTRARSETGRSTCAHTC